MSNGTLRTPCTIGLGRVGEYTHTPVWYIGTHHPIVLQLVKPYKGQVWSEQTPPKCIVVRPTVQTYSEGSAYQNNTVYHSDNNTVSTHLMERGRCREWFHHAH